MGRIVANDPLQKYRFKVSVPGLPAGMGFQKVSGIAREVEVVEYDEGGFINTHKMSGKEKVEDIVLEVGQYSNTDLEELYKECFTDHTVRKTITIEQMDKFGEVQRTWVLGEAWISKWEADELDATSSDVAIEKITITFEYYL